MKVVFVMLLACYVSTVDAASSVPKYDRSEWKHWIDADRDGQHTRTEVLIRDAVRVTMSENGKEVLSGTWVSPYTGAIITDPDRLCIDHVYALWEAHYSGGWRWSAAQKQAYANDLDWRTHLLAVECEVNSQKGRKDEAAWLPAEPYRCRYVQTRMMIRWKYRFWISGKTKRVAESILSRCRFEGNLH